MTLLSLSKKAGVIFTASVFAVNIVLLILYGLNNNQLEDNFCNVTFQDNYTLTFEWPVPPYYNATVHFDSIKKLDRIRCGYFADDINGTFGGWYCGQCLGNTCNIKNEYELPLYILIGIFALSLFITLILMCQSENKYERLT